MMHKQQTAEHDSFAHRIPPALQAPLVRHRYMAGLARLDDGDR
jgi:hypothetical protein